MSNVTVVDHPLVQHKLTLMRRSETPTGEFRRLLREISLLLAYEVMRDLPTELIDIQTPIAPMRAPALAGKKLCFVSVLRAGSGILEGMLDLVPSARVGHIGLYRDPQTLAAVEYYFKVPDDIPERDVIVVDPMLATANSAIAALHRLKGCGARSIKYRLSRRRARRHQGFAGRPCRRADLHRRHRRQAQRSRLYRARPRRRRRPPLRHEIATEDRPRCPFRGASSCAL